MSSAIFSFITVVDVPDLDPQFLGLPYVTAVDENSPVVSDGEFEKDASLDSFLNVCNSR